MNYLKNEKS